MDGIKKLCFWLENIESCAPQSPVMIIGTHKDKLSPRNLKVRNQICYVLDQIIREMYMTEDADITRMLPRLDGFIYFLDTRNPKEVEVLRDDIYDYALQFTPSMILNLSILILI